MYVYKYMNTSKFHIYINVQKLYTHKYTHISHVYIFTDTHTFYIYIYFTYCYIVICRFTSTYTHSIITTL